MLTLTKLGNTQIRITVKPNYDNGATQKLDYLYVVAGGANPNPATVGDLKLSEGGVDALSVDINYQTLTYPIDRIEIKWSTIGMDGEWATTVTNILESNLCLPTIVDENTDLTSLTPGTCDLTLIRNFVMDGDWNTICLPFALTADQVKEVFGKGTELTKLSSSTLKSSTEVDIQFEKVTSMEMEAATPYLIKPEKNVNEGVFLENVTINTTPNILEAGITKMIPVLKTQAFTGENNTFFLGANEVLYKASTSGNIMAMRAYFQFSTLTPEQLRNVRARVVFNENTETSVDNITIDEAPIKVIQNGQLIIIRNGVKYNVQGQKL